MAEMLTRPMQDNRLLRATGAVDLRVNLGTALGQLASQPMTTSLAGSNIESVQLAGESLRLLDVDLEQRLADLREQSSDLPYGPEWDAAFAEMTRIADQMNQGGTAEGQRIAIESGAVVSAEDLQSRYGEYGLTFDRPMTEEEAAILVEGKRAELIRNAIINAAPGGVGSAVAKFGASMVAMATDPLEVATMFIPIVGQAGRAAAIGRFGRVGGRTAVGAIEGGVGSLLTEPLYGMLSRSMQLDYEMSEGLLNVGLGIVLGGGIGSVAGALARRTAPDAATAPPGVDIDMPTADRAADVAPQPQAPLRLTESMRIATLQRPVAEMAIRQFVTDTHVDVRAFMPDVAKLRAELDDAFRAAEQAIIDSPHSVPGDGSFRYNTGFGYVSASGKSVDDGVRQVSRSIDGEVDISRLEVWDGQKFIPAEGVTDVYLRTESGPIESVVQAQDNVARAQDKHSLAVLAGDVVAQASKEGYTLTTPDAVATMMRLSQHGYDVPDAARKMGLIKDKDIAARAARHAEALDPDDIEHSQRVDANQEFNSLADIRAVTEETRAMYDQLTDLPDEIMAEIEAARANKAYADHYAEIARVAATCMARG